MPCGAEATGGNDADMPNQHCDHPFRATDNQRCSTVAIAFRARIVHQ